MAPTVIEVLETLTSRIEELKKLQDNLRLRIKDLEEENRDLKSRLSLYQQEIALQANDIEFLKISHKLAESPDNIMTARKTIARLIRNIDSCIRILKEE